MAKKTYENHFDTSMTPFEYAISTGDAYTSYVRWDAVPKNDFRDGYIEIDSNFSYWIQIDVESDQSLRNEIYAGTVVTSPGTQKIFHNRNNQYANLSPTADFRGYQDPTISALGNLFRENLSVSGVNVGSAIARDKFEYKIINQTGLFRIYNIGVAAGIIILTLNVFRLEDY